LEKKNPLNFFEQIVVENQLFATFLRKKFLHAISNMKSSKNTLLCISDAGKLVLLSFEA